MKKILFLSIILGLMSFSVVAPVSAASVFDDAKTNLKSGGEAAYGEGAETNLTVAVGRIINAFLLVLGIVLTVVIIRGGFMYMTAGGNDEQVAKAKKWIINGVIGLVIILLAFAISNFVLDRLLTATSTPTPTPST